MTDAQFAVLRRICEATAAVGDAFGSEATSPGLAIPVDFKGMAEACRRFLPERLAPRPLRFEGFLTRYAVPSRRPEVAAFVTLIGHFPVEAAYVAPEGFDPEAHSRGAFWIALLVDAREAAGARVLIAFERVET